MLQIWCRLLFERHLKVLHTYCLNYNLGDYALGIGVKNLLRQFFSIDFIAETNLQGREFNRYYIHEVINKRYDLLVIGGGGIIHGSHWPNGWFWLIDIDLIKEIKIPFIVFGVGYNYWKEEKKIPERAIEHLKETKKWAAYFSVRNDGSAKRLLEDTGISARIIPDPGFHIDLNTKYDRIILEDYVIIQLANDKPEYRFGNLENKKKFIAHMKEVTKRLAENYKVVFAPHVYEDIELSASISEGIQNSLVWDFGYYSFDHVNEAIAHYKYSSFVLAMRGHGQILPIAFKTPIISIENHPKHRGLMEELGLSDYNVKVGDDNFVKKIFQKIDLVSNSNLTSTYKEIRLALNQTTEREFIFIKEKICDGR